MGAAAIIFDQGEKHNVLITIPTVILLSQYTPRIEVRAAYNSAIVFEYEADLDINGQQILLTIPASATESINGKFIWQLMITSKTDPDDVVKFSADSFIINPAIVFKA